MKTIKNANKGAVKTAKVSTINTTAKVSKDKGDPSKADKALLDEYAAECVLRKIFSVPKKTPMRTKLGKHEKAYRAERIAEHEKELAAKRKKKGYFVTMTAVSISDGKVMCVDPINYKSIEEAITASVNELCEMFGFKLPTKFTPSAKKVKYKSSKGWWVMNTEDGIDDEEDDTAIIKAYSADSDYTIVWYLREHFGK